MSSEKEGMGCLARIGIAGLLFVGLSIALGTWVDSGGGKGIDSSEPKGGKWVDSSKSASKHARTEVAAPSKPTPPSGRDQAAAAPAAPAPPPLPETPFDALLAQAKTDLDPGDFWYLERSRNLCPDKDDDESDKVGLPPGSNEFQRHANESKRAGLKAKVSETIYKLDLGDISHGKYDFKRNVRKLFIRSDDYTFTGTARADCEDGYCDWEMTPLGPRPTRDALKLDLAVDPTLAESLGDDEDVYTITILARVTGLHRHTRCVRSCLFGVCGSDNHGAGLMAKGKLVAVRVDAKGKRLYEKLHEQP
jgi:hypothetical protein